MERIETIKIDQPHSGIIPNQTDVERILETEMGAKEALEILEAVTKRSSFNVSSDRVEKLIADGALKPIPESIWEMLKEKQTQASNLFVEAQKQQEILSTLEYKLEREEEIQSNPFIRIGYGINSLFGGLKGDEAQERYNALETTVAELRKSSSTKKIEAENIQRELDKSDTVHKVGDIPVALTEQGKEIYKTLNGLRQSLNGQTAHSVCQEVSNFDQQIQTLLSTGEKVYSALLQGGYDRDDEALENLALTIAKNKASPKQTLKLLAETENGIQDSEVTGKRKLQLLQIIAGKTSPDGAQTLSLSSSAAKVKLLSSTARSGFAAHYVAAQLFGVKEEPTSARVRVFDEVFNSLLKNGFKHAGGQGAYLASRFTLRPDPIDAKKRWEKTYSALGGSLRSIDSTTVQTALILSGLPGSETANVKRWVTLFNVIQDKNQFRNSSDSKILAAQLASIPGDTERVMFLFNRAHDHVCKSWVTTNTQQHAVGLIGGALIELIREGLERESQTGSVLSNDTYGGYTPTDNSSSIWFFNTDSGPIDIHSGSSGFETLGGFTSGDVGFSIGDMGGLSDGGAGCGSSSGFSSSSSGSSCSSSSGSSCSSSGGSSCSSGGSSCGGGGGCGGGS
jgi:hypothetical protein